MSIGCLMEQTIFLNDIKHVLYYLLQYIPIKFKL